MIGPEGIKIEEDKRYSGLANTKVCQEYTKVLGIGKLLLLIH